MNFAVYMPFFVGQAKYTALDDNRSLFDTVSVSFELTSLWLL